MSARPGTAWITTKKGWGSLTLTIGRRNAPRMPVHHSTLSARAPTR